jgi:hypothetical protein
MRKVIEEQMKIGEVSIADIQFDLSSRDEIPKLLIGLQSIYCDKKIRARIFQLLEELVPDNVDPNNGRRGMDLWKILVLGTVRLGCGWDYDKLQDTADNHATLRLMLGHSRMDNYTCYPLQTLKDNLTLFTPELLDKINIIAVEHGHKVIGLSTEEKLNASCDSYVVETDVHFPTDTNLLWDALRRTIILIMRLCDELGLTDWRQGKDHLRKIKRLFLIAQRMKHSNSKDKKKREERSQLIINIHLLYLELAQLVVEKAKNTLDSVSTSDFLIGLKIEEIKKYIGHAERQIDQVRRRVVDGETIPHHEKVFSIFEEHTEWIKKGKMGKPVELGLAVCIIKDQFGLILYHRVMQNETDDKVAVPMIRETINRFSNLSSCSFDKGFHSPSNQEELAELLEKVILPRKGKLSAVNKEVENSEEFKRARRKHSAVESSISALENHGLDRCPDHGLDGFKRYVALGVLARNLQIIGHAIQQKQLKREQRLRKRQNAKMVVNF